MFIWDVYFQFEKWVCEYGLVYSLIFGIKVMIVFLSDKVVKEFLDKKSNMYLYCQEMYFGQIFCSGDFCIFMMGYIFCWCMCCKMVYIFFNIFVVKFYVFYQMFENKQMFFDIFNIFECVMYYVCCYINFLIIIMVFGWCSEIYDDFKMMQFFDGFGEFVEFNQIGVVGFMDFFFIICYFFDFMFFVCVKVKELYKKEKVFYLGYWFKVKQDIFNGIIICCFFEDLVEV